MGRPIRHPDVREYTAAGKDLGQSPLSHDGFGAVVSAAYYAYRSSATSQETKALAKSIVGRFSNYLVLNQWRLMSHYPDLYSASERREKPPEDGEKEGKTGTYFAHLYSTPDWDDTGKGWIKFKGPETWVIAPHERYALKNAAAEMGFSTSGWSVWSGVSNQLIQAGADWVVKQVGYGVDTLLTRIQFDERYSFRLGGYTVKGDIELSISDSARKSIVTAVEDVVRGLIRSYNLAALQSGELVHAVADQLASRLPGPLGKDDWRSILTGTIAGVLPWTDGSAIGELVAFAGMLEAQRNEYGGTTDKSDFFVTHVNFWSALMMYETRPETGALLNPLVDKFYESVSGNDPGLYAWLVGDTGRVATLRRQFETEPKYAKLDYRWERSYDSQQDRLGKDSYGYSRLDYLVLSSLEDHGRPKTVVEYWKNWGKKLSDLRDRVWKALREELSRRAQDIWEATGRWTRERWDAARGWVQETWEKGGRYLERRWNAAGAAISVYREEGAKAVYQEFKNGKQTLERRWQDGERTLERRWEGEKQTLERQWKNGKQTLERQWKNGKQTLERRWQKGKQTLERRWEGEKQTLERQWKDGKRTLEAVWKGGVNTLYKKWNSSEVLVSKYWRDGAKTFYREYKKGTVVLERQWKGGKQIAEKVWDDKKKKLVDAIGKLEKRLPSLDPGNWL